MLEYIFFLCYIHQVFNGFAKSIPIIKATGVEWTEPKGNGKGNLTLIMIPQNNSCNNDTDMLIAVKSDYQVVSQDTQLLNLVINENINDSINESRSIETGNQGNGINTSNSVGTQDHKLDQQDKCEKNNNMINEVGPNRTSNNNAMLNDSINASNNNQHKQVNSPNPTENANDFKFVPSSRYSSQNNTGSETTLKAGGSDQNNASRLDVSNCPGNENQYKTTTSPITVVSIKSGKLDQINELGKNNNTGTDLTTISNINQYNETNLSKESQEIKMSQPVVENDTCKVDNVEHSNRNIGVTNSLIPADFLKFLNLGGELEQHSELDAAKSSYNANFYEPEKKPLSVLVKEAKEESNMNNGKEAENKTLLVQANEQSKINTSNEAEKKAMLTQSKEQTKVNTGNESEKKTPLVQAKEQSRMNTGNEHNLPTKESSAVGNKNAVNIFKFLSAVQAKTTIAANTKELPNVFKFFSLAETKTDAFLDNQVDDLVGLEGDCDSKENPSRGEDIPLKMSRKKNNLRKKVIPITMLKENRQGFPLGQEVKMRFDGKNIILEEMPSCRSETVENCASTQSIEPPSNEMILDKEESEIMSKTKTCKSKPTIKMKGTSEQTESSGTSYSFVTTQITSKHPDRTSKMKVKESYTLRSSISSIQNPITTEPAETQSVTQSSTKIEITVEKSEGRKKVYSQTITETTKSEFGKLNKTDEGSLMYVTECKTLKVINNTALVKTPTCQDADNPCITLWQNEQNNDTAEISTRNSKIKTSINILGDEYSSQSGSVAPRLNDLDDISTESYIMTNSITKSTTVKSKPSTSNVEDNGMDLYSPSVMSQLDRVLTTPHYDLGVLVTEESQISTPLLKSLNKGKTSDNNVIVPADSVKEIVIQIIRNTKEPAKKSNAKSNSTYREAKPCEDEMYYKTHISTFDDAKIKPGSFEMEMSNVEERNNKEGRKYLYPELHKEEYYLGSNKQNPYPYFKKENILLDNNMGKNNIENLKKLNPQSGKIIKAYI